MGSLLISAFTDKWGRQRTCLGFLLLHSISLLIGAFSPFVLLTDFITVILGLSETVLTAAVFLLLNESLPSDLRSWYSGLSIAFWSAGTLVDALLFYLLPSWREVMLIAAVIAFGSSIALMRVTESVRWLVANKKDFSGGLAILRKIAKANGLNPLNISLPPLSNTGDNAAGEVDSINSGFGGLLSSKELRRRAFYATFLWATSTLCYYGLLLCLSSYSGNIYENGIALSIGELSVTLLAGRFMDRFPRRTAFLVSEVIAALATAGAWLAGLEPSPSFLPMVGLFVGMAATDALFLMVYVYTAELFPTKVRAAGYALTSSASRIGGFLASNLLLLETYTGTQPLLILAGAMLFSTLPCICLPETLGQPLLDYH